MIDENRLARQKSILRSWASNSCRGTLEACTGFGKTYTAILAIKALNVQQPSQKTLVIVPTIHLKRQWQDQVSELDGVTVLVINTAIKYEHDVNLLILDEIHNYATNTFGSIFERVKYKKILGLTATVTRQDGNDYILRMRAPIVATVKLEEALSAGYVSPFRVLNVPVYLTDQDREDYQKLSKNFSYYFSKFGNDFGQAMNCLKSEKACENFARRSTDDAGQVRINAINFNRNMAKRKKMLYMNQSKVDSVYRLCTDLTYKTITFSESVDFAEAVTNRLPDSVSYSSKMPVKRRREALESFTSGNTRVINTARALDEGFDVPGVELAIISSGSSSPRQDVQRTGRAIRFVEGKIGYIVNLYMPDTQDEKWMKKRQQNSTSIQHVQSLDQAIHIMGGDIDLSHLDITL
jgi:superfamily II DNA or RNA helicase